MPQKLNKAGQMQDYIPKGNGDASGEYGTSNGTNKNFTTSDKKKTEANVITENKSVVVGKKLSEDEYNKQMRKLQNESVKAEKAKDWDKFKQIHDEMKKLVRDNGKEDWKINNKPLNNKANIIDNDLTGKGNKEIKDIIDSYKIKDANGKTAEEYAKEIKVEVDKWEKDYDATKQKSEKQYGKRTNEARLKDIARLRYENIDALSQEEDYNYIGEESGYLGYGSLDKLEKATAKRVATNNIAKKILSKK